MTGMIARLRGPEGHGLCKSANKLERTREILTTRTRIAQLPAVVELAAHVTSVSPCALMRLTSKRICRATDWVANLSVVSEAIASHSPPHAITYSKRTHFQFALPCSQRG
jgi:hypothetical protein